MRKFTVVVAEHYPFFLREMVRLLAVEFDVLGTADDGQDALDLIRTHTPDVAVLDLYLPSLSGIAIARSLSKDVHKPAVVICSLEDDSITLQAAHRAGALGYVLKPMVHQDLILAVQRALQGHFFLSPRISNWQPPEDRMNRSEGAKLRRATRYYFGGAVELADEGSGRTLVAMVRALNLYGCFVRTAHAFQFGAQLLLTMTHDGKQFSAHGRVVNQNDTGIGVEFTEISAVDRLRLEACLSELAQTTGETK